MAQGNQPVRRCIAVGCLLLRLSETKIPPSLWHVPEFKRWSRLVAYKLPGEPYPPDPILTNTPALERDLHRFLLSSLHQPYVQLLQERWVEMAFRVSHNDPEKGIVRVYLLPDDVERRVVDRSDASLRKARRQLLSQLDFSQDAWAGEDAPNPPPAPTYHDDEPEGENEQTLLQMFNAIPSPTPQPERIQDHYAQDAAHDLLGDEVVGLKTELYPYQRRSAAVMLERESQPYRILDPRLAKAVDQNGQPWYYDSVNGFGLLEPRCYDGVNGGILAEEMGAGKTLICLALILATKHQTSQLPEIFRGGPIVRPRVGSLADMAAASINRNTLPWKPWFGTDGHYELDYQNCREYLRRNPGHYFIPREERRRTRQPAAPLPARKVYLSYATLVIVPGNLVQQWKQELSKHTVPGSLRTVVITGKQKIPPAEELIETEIVLSSSSAFERLCLQDDHPLRSIHFKRCIIDEGHRLGSSTPSAKSNLLLALDSLQLSARWVVTGTPAKGLFGVESSARAGAGAWARKVDFSGEQEKDDLKRIGAITTLYLRSRPWANTITDYGDQPAEWAVYVLQPKHSRRSRGRKDCLRATLDSLIIRHRLQNLSELLPVVNEKVVYLDGSYQDRLCLNLFSMVILLNAVTSQRTDQDYFFHPRNRKPLLQLVANLRQSTFFGGPFFSSEAITQAVEIATEFLDDRKFPISPEDESLVREAITFGRNAAANDLKQCSNAFGELPLYVKDFPGGLGKAWSLDDRAGDPVCTDARMILAMQRFLRPALDAPHSLRFLFRSGKFEQEGRETRLDALIPETTPAPGKRSSVSASPASTPAPTTAAPTPTPTPRKPKPQKVAREATREVDNAQHRRLSSRGALSSQMPVDQDVVGDIAKPLARTRIISTASAKMSYLLDQISRYQRTEKIIVFYENDNVAWHIDFMLEIVSRSSNHARTILICNVFFQLDIPHLIYTGTLKLDRRAQYIATFNQNPRVR